MPRAPLPARSPAAQVVTRSLAAQVPRGLQVAEVAGGDDLGEDRQVGLEPAAAGSPAAAGGPIRSARTRASRSASRTSVRLARTSRCSALRPGKRRIARQAVDALGQATSWKASERGLVSSARSRSSTGAAWSMLR